jgi:hypothetical protein
MPKYKPTRMMMAMRTLPRVVMRRVKAVGSPFLPAKRRGPENP